MKVLPDRIFPDTWVSWPEFKFLSNYLTSQGWLNFNDAIFEVEVREFYQWLVFDDNLEITSTVNEIEIRLLVENLAQILGVPYVGFMDYTYQSWSFVPGVDNATICRTLSDQPLPYA